MEADFARFSSASPFLVARSDSSNTNLTRGLLDFRGWRGGIFAARALTVFRASIRGWHSAIRELGDSRTRRFARSLGFPSPLPPLPRPLMLRRGKRLKGIQGFFPLYTIWSAHGSFSSSSVLSNVARFLDLPSNQSEQPLLVYNEMFSRVLVS